jgi:methionine-rich copper-binding protein CopC
MTRNNAIRRPWLALLVATMLVLAIPGLALGHAELETPTPADKSLVPPPVSEVSGIYSEAMTPNGSSIVVKNTSGATVASGSVDPEDDTRMVATPAPPLGIGTFTVEWTSVALDGHVERGTWTFTVGVAAPPVSSPTGTPVASIAPTAAATGSAVAPTSSPSTVPSPAPSADGTDSQGGADVVLPIIVALLVLVAGAAYLLTRRNRPSGPTTPTGPTSPPDPT